jgi:hypothetical protein
MSPTFQPLADAGFAWFSIDYRMAPEFRFPQAIEDLDTSIRWLKANAAKYHVDPAKIVLIGESAGAFLVIASLFVIVNTLGSGSAPAGHDIVEIQRRTAQAHDLQANLEADVEAARHYIESERMRAKRMGYDQG